MKQVYVWFVSLISFSALQAQPVIEWRGSFGGTDYETPSAVKPTPDGGIIIAGTTYSTDGDAAANKGVSDIIVVKLKADRTIDWKQTLGGSNEDGAHDLQVTSDGGYIIAGYTKSADGDVTQQKGAGDYWVIKMRANGSIAWQRTYGGSYMDVASSIRQLPGGGYIVAGYTMSNNNDVSGNHFEQTQDAWIIKLDENGNMVWQRCYGGTNSEFAYTIELAGNGFIFSGYARSQNGDVQQNKGHQDVWIVKLKDNGEIEWQRTLGGAMNEAAYDVKPVPGGGYIAVGTTSSTNGDVTGNHGTTDMWVTRLSANGTVVWSRCLGGSSLEAARSVAVASNGQFIITGSAESNDHDVLQLHGRSDYWVVALNNNGNIDWQKNLGGSDIDDATATSFSNGKLLVAGTSFSADHDVIQPKNGGDIWAVEMKFNLPVPSINVQPKDTTVCEGNAAIFKIAGDNISAYQWQAQSGSAWIDLSNNGTYDGVHTNTLTIATATSNTSKAFRCIVSNQYNQVISRTASVNFLGTINVITQPASSTSCSGSEVTIAIAAQHAHFYQWQQSTNGSNWQNITTGTNSSVKIKVAEGITQYRCIISNPCTSAMSQPATVTGRNCSVPNAFSPNGDGINDKWMIPFLNDFADVHVNVFDRYGSQVFRSTGRYQPWDGSNNQRTLPVGVYYYVIQLDKHQKPFSGSLAIMK